MELFDCFENLEIEDSPNIPSSCPNYPPFSPCYHNKNWYFDKKFDENQTSTSISDTDLFRALSLFHSEKYQDALNIFLKIHSSTKNNRFHEIMLIDSILQCYIKMPEASFDEAVCQHYISLFEQLVVDFGDQIQFLRTKAQILARFNNLQHSEEFRDTVCLLLCLSDLPEHWLLFGTSDCLMAHSSKNFKISCLVQSLIGYEYQLPQANGFIKNKISQKIEDLKSKLGNLEPDSQKIEEVHAAMVSQYRHHRADFDNSDDKNSEFQAHNCRMKNIKVEGNLQAEMIANFKSKYQFFSD